MKKGIIVIVCYINALPFSTLMLTYQIRKNKKGQDLTQGSLHSKAGVPNPWATAHYGPAVCSEPGHTSDGQALIELHLHKHPCRLCEWSCACLHACLPL